MKVSKVQAQLTGEDLLSIINEFLDVEGLELKEVIVDKNIKVKGRFTKGVSVDFYGELEIQGAKEGKVYCRFSKFKAFKLGLFRGFRSFGLKILTNKLPIKGLISNKDEIIIDINKVLINIPFVELEILDVFIKGNYLVADISEINIFLKGNIIKVEEEENEEDLPEEEIGEIEKIKDNYSEGRKIIGEKLPEKVKPLSDYLFVIPDIITLIYRLLKDNRVEIKTKLLISGAIAYVVVPTDLIPKKLPLIGKIDDLAVVFFSLNKVVNDVPLKIILENWEGKNDLVLVLKNGLEYIVNFTGAKNVEKLYRVIEELKTL